MKVFILLILIILASCNGSVYSGGARIYDSEKNNYNNYFIIITNNSPNEIYVKYTKIVSENKEKVLIENISVKSKININVKPENGTARVKIGFDKYEKEYIHRIPVFRSGKEWEIGLNEILDLTFHPK